MDFESPSSQAVERALGKIVASGLISPESRQAMLLTKIVTEELAGRGDRLKSYSLAIDVFGQGDDFDPATNSIVRVEMHRLRRTLGLYNATLGRREKVKIILTSGSYRPKFEIAEDAVPIDAEAGDTSGGDRAPPGRPPRMGGRAIAALTSLVMVLVALAFWRIEKTMPDCSLPRPSLEVATGGARSSDQITLIRAQLSSTLGLYPLVVGVDRNTKPCAGAPGYLATIKVLKINNSDIVSAELTRRNSSEVIWSENYPLSREVTAPELDLVVAKIAYRLANEDRMIPLDAYATDWKKAEAKRQFTCIMDAHFLFQAEYEELRQPALDCLTKIADAGSKHADVYGLLAAFHYYIAHDFWPGDVAESRAKFEEYLAKGSKIDPMNREILINNLREARDQKPPATEEILRVGTIIQPMASADPHLLNQLSRSLGIGLGEWGEATKLSERAFEIVGESHLIATTVYSTVIASGDWERARAFMNKFKYADMETIAVLNLAVAIHLDFPDIRRESISTLANFGLDSRQKVEDFVNVYYLHPSIGEPLLAEIRKVPPQEFTKPPAVPEVVVKPPTE